MPTLHRFVDRPGHYVKGISNGKPVTLQLTAEGEQYLTETLGLGHGAKFSGDTLKLLYRRKWALPMEAPPAAEAPADTPPQPGEEPPPARPEPNPVVFQGALHIRLTGGDQVLLDQSTEEVVRTLGRSGAVVVGPIPLPVHLEPYTVVRDGARRVWELRVYQRLVRVRHPRRQTVEAMNELRLPREVDVKVDMQPGS